MIQGLEYDSHQRDENGNPDGGHTAGKGFNITWQKGPLVVDGERQEPNGAFVETVLQACLSRLSFYQTSRFFCNENAAAIEYVTRAIQALQARSRDRELRGVEGTHQV